MSEGTGSIRSIEWTELFPWLMLFRAFGLSTSIPILFLATIGVCLTPLGWMGADSLFLSDSDREGPLGATIALHRSWPAQTQVYSGDPDTDFHLPTSCSEFLSPTWQVFASYVTPFRQLVREDLTAREFAYFSMGAVWNLLVWAFFGGVITRIAVMRFGREEREGFLDAIRYVARRFLSFFTAPLFPLVGVALVVLLSYPVGLCLNSDVGILIAAILWFFVLLGGLILTILLLGLLLGWPLMWGTLSSEELGDVFEAAQRSYSFTFSRPFHYAFYATVILTLGSGAFLFVHLFSESVLYLSEWAVSRGWGSGSPGALESNGSEIRELGVALIGRLNDLVVTIASAFRFSFFWCAVGALYLLMRRATDHTEFDNVYVPRDQAAMELPPLSTDAEGVPGVDES